MPETTQRVGAGKGRYDMRRDMTVAGAYGDEGGSEITSLSHTSRKVGQSVVPTDVIERLKVPNWHPLWKLCSNLFSSEVTVMTES